MPDQRVIGEFRSRLQGEVIEPGDATYDEARRLYNGMIDKRPGLIARCANVADVIASLELAREHDLLIAIRGCGHNGAGLGSCDGGVVIDLGQMNGIRVDPATRTVRAQAGCPQGAVDNASHPFGLHVPAGTVSTTGIGGLTLGGGHGYLTRKWGYTIDNLLEADVVLADGSFVTASAEQNEDLFWALRGGGGNFGIVTSFTYQAHEVSDVVAGPMFWPVERAPEVMRWYADFMPQASEDLYGFFAYLKVPPAAPFPEDIHSRPVCGIVWCYLGGPEEADAELRDLRGQFPPLFEHVGPMPFTTLQTLFDPLLPPGMQWYWKGDFFTELPDEAIAKHVEYGSSTPTPLSTMHLYPVDGAGNRADSGDMAFSYREAKWSMVIAGIDPDPANADALTQWARDYWNALHPYSAGGAYVNFMMEEGADRVQAVYRDNHARLVEVKTKYDPENVFRVNQNIAPR